jgi:hypothetical protein
MAEANWGFRIKVEKKSNNFTIKIFLANKYHFDILIYFDITEFLKIII